MIERRDAVLNTHLHLWGWEIATYLFLGGLAAGLLIFASWAHLAGRRREYLPAVRFATLSAPMLVAIGLFVLWLDLGSKWQPFWLYVTLKPLSPMSWGAWILLAVLITSGLAAVPMLASGGTNNGVGNGTRRGFRSDTGNGWQRGAVLPLFWSTRLQGVARWVGPRVRELAYANLWLGVTLGLYTGILLGTMVARPALNSPVLAPLFLISGMSAAAALLLLALPGGPWQRLLTRAEVALHSVKLGLVGLYLIGLATSTAAAQATAAHLMTGPWAWAFWPLVVGAGMVFPLGVSLAERGTHHVPRRLAVLAGSLALAGGLALRVVLVYAGQRGL